jgi:hypothetical protein
LSRTNDTASLEAGQVAGEVIEGVELPRGDDFVHLRNPEQTLIECPVAHPAQCHAVDRSVIMFLAPWNDVRRRDGSMAIERTDADATQGTTMGICSNDSPSKALVADGRKVRLL